MPYYNVRFHFWEEDITQACLVLVASTYCGEKPFHLHVRFEDAAWQKPLFRGQTKNIHPGVLEQFSNCMQTYYQAVGTWTLRSVGMHLLSYLIADTHASDEGEVDLRKWRNKQNRTHDPFICKKCGFHGAYKSPGLMIPWRPLIEQGFLNKLLALPVELKAEVFRHLGPHDSKLISSVSHLLVLCLRREYFLFWWC